MDVLGDLHAMVKIFFIIATCYSKFSSATPQPLGIPGNTHPTTVPFILRPSRDTNLTYCELDRITYQGEAMQCLKDCLADSCCKAVSIQGICEKSFVITETLDFVKEVCICIESLYILQGRIQGGGAHQVRPPPKFLFSILFFFKSFLKDFLRVFVLKSPSECSYNAPFVIDTSKNFPGGPP